VVDSVETKLTDLTETKEQLEKELKTLTETLPLAKQIVAAEAQVVTLGEQVTSLAEEGEIITDLAALTAEGEQLGAEENKLSEKLGQVQTQQRDLDPAAQQRLATSEQALAEFGKQIKELEKTVADGVDSEVLSELTERLEAQLSLLAEERGRLPELRKAAEKARLEATQQEKEYDELQ
jgi:hypothetical protein